MINFALLHDAVVSAARAAFTDLRAAHSTETFYAFALYSDDGAMTIEPAANSEEALRRAARENDLSSTPDWLRWSTGEWPHEAEGGDYFQAAYELLNAPDRYEGGDEEDDSGAFAAFREQVFQTMIDALAVLDAEGFWGTGDDRNAVTLFCTVSDSDEAERIENDSARRLNPPAIYERFAARKLDE